MELEQTVGQGPAGEAPAQAPDTLRAEIDALIAQLSATPAAPSAEDVSERRAAATQLSVKLQALALRHPTAQTHGLLNQLLDGNTLDDHLDARGVSCRAAVVAAQVSLGYPWALEVAPEDLELLRESASGRRGGISRWATFVSALASFAWSAGVAVSMLSELHRERELLLLGPFALGAAHAVGALVVSAATPADRPAEDRRRAARWYSALGWMGLVGPLFSGIAALALTPDVFWVGMFCASPAMLTAACAAVAAASIKPKTEER